MLQALATAAQSATCVPSSKASSQFKEIPASCARMLEACRSSLASVECYRRHKKHLECKRMFLNDIKVSQTFTGPTEGHVAAIRNQLSGKQEYRSDMCWTEESPTESVS